MDAPVCQAPSSSSKQVTIAAIHPAFACVELPRALMESADRGPITETRSRRASSLSGFPGHGLTCGAITR
jgi:hypothetical protein